MSSIETEDELHFLFRCNKLLDIRIKHYYKFPEILNMATDIDKLKFLIAQPHLNGNILSTVKCESSRKNRH